MNQKIRFSKKNTYIGLFVFFVLLIVILSSFALQNNHVNNSRASEINNTVQSLSPAQCPTNEQLGSAIQLKVIRSNSGDIELFGEAPQTSIGMTYSTYIVCMRESDETLLRVDTFIASPDELKIRFTTFWKPAILVSDKDVETNDFLLYEIK